MKISLIHASYKSKGQSKNSRDKWFAQASNPLRVEHCLGFEYSDSSVREDYDIPDSVEAGITLDGKTRFITTVGQDTPSAVRNWNAAASISTGDILFVVADDLVPDHGWDNAIEEMVNKLKSPKAIFVLSDRRCSEKLGKHREDDLLPRHPVVTRELYRQYKFIFNPKYFSVGCDNEWLLVSLESGALEDARTITLHHSLGKLFDAKGSMRCGCDKQNESLSPSQIRMRDKKMRSAANLLLDEWGFWWRLIEFFGSLPLLADYVFNAYTKLRNRKSLNPTYFCLCFFMILLRKNPRLLFRNLPILFFEFAGSYILRSVFAKMKEIR